MEETIEKSIETIEKFDEAVECKGETMALNSEILKKSAVKVPKWQKNTPLRLTGSQTLSYGKKT